MKPPVPLVLGGDQHFSAAFSTFTFAANTNVLIQQLNLHPLSLEVWASREESDSLVGIAKVCTVIRIVHTCIYTLTRLSTYSGSSRRSIN